MTVQETTNLPELLALLESRYAMRILYSLNDKNEKTFRLLQSSVVGITPNTLNTRLKQLRETGLVAHNKKGYHATELGIELIKHIKDLQPIANQLQQKGNQLQPTTDAET
jgi:DNA-binding HxlR family transcriptional regulator